MKQAYPDPVYLQCTVRALPGGHMEPTFLWNENPARPLSLSRHCLRSLGYHFKGDDYPRRVAVGGVPLRLLEVRGFEYDAALYLREDQGRWRWLRYGLASRLRYLSAFVGVRLIYTLMIWNLAHIPMGERPAWKHVRWPKFNSLRK